MRTAIARGGARAHKVDIGVGMLALVADEEQRKRLAEIAEKCPVHKILVTANVVVTHVDP